MPGPAVPLRRALGVPDAVSAALSELCRLALAREDGEPRAASAPPALAVGAGLLAVGVALPRAEEESEGGGVGLCDALGDRDAVPLPVAPPALAEAETLLQGEEDPPPPPLYVPLLLALALTVVAPPCVAPLEAVAPLLRDAAPLADADADLLVDAQPDSVPLPQAEASEL